ncbi:hypothetical protein [Metabacillus halosaccharovorans]|uniref:hypothetical protein n=1 Tax=Metabacillus halosaccharovorans TaxID=930124 RepID=UPI000995107F|nr:hypothetical protein [Metabacillus halosaccharovorans]
MVFNEENEKLIDELAKSIVQELTNLKKNDNSSIHIEGNTLLLLILYLFNTRISSKDMSTATKDMIISDEIIEQFEKMIDKTEDKFEEIIKILKTNT